MDVTIALVSRIKDILCIFSLTKLGQAVNDTVNNVIFCHKEDGRVSAYNEKGLRVKSD
jgi:hypothetical protein